MLGKSESTVNALPSPHHNDHKRPRLSGRTRPCLCLFEFSGWQVDLVRSSVDVHGLGSNSGHYGLCNLPFATLLLDNTELAFAGARECLMAIPARRVHSRANGKIADYLAIVCAHYEHLLRFAASDEESVLLSIDG